MKRLAAILLFATLAAACGKDPFFDPNVGISVDPTSLSLHIGESATITASVTPEDLPNKNVLWTTDNTSVAKVSGGVVSAVGVGSATITAKTDWGGRTAKCRVTVLSPVLVESVNLGRSALSLDPKAGPFTFSPSIMPEDATDKGLSWTSSDESVVAVSDGVVTVKGKGTATVTATAKDAGHASASCTVTVINIPDAVDLGGLPSTWEPIHRKPGAISTPGVNWRPRAAMHGRTTSILPALPARSRSTIHPTESHAWKLLTMSHP